jgi:hypothetical protein
MLKQQLLPMLLMSIDIWAAIIYACTGDWRHAGYWFSAAAITLFVTI